MKIIKQRHGTDCVIASTAMWLKKTYDEIMERAKELGVEPSKVGMYNEQEDKLLKSFGIFPARIWHYAGGVEGVLSVPSLNNKYGSHAVYVNNNTIYDPQLGVKGKESFPSDLRIFPSHINCVIDLNNDYSRDIYKTLLDREKKVLRSWRKTSNGIDKLNEGAE